MQGPTRVNWNGPLNGTHVFLKPTVPFALHAKVDEALDSQARCFYTCEAFKVGDSYCACGKKQMTHWDSVVITAALYT